MINITSAAKDRDSAILERETTLLQIINVFEDFLRARNIKVPCEDDDFYADVRETEVIYGENYGELEDNLEDKLVQLGIFEKRRTE